MTDPARNDRDADAALNESAERFVTHLRHAKEKRARAERIGVLLQQNHFAESFYAELMGGKRWTTP